MSHIPPYLRVITGGLDRDFHKAGKGARVSREAKNEPPALVTISSSRLTGLQQAEQALQSIIHAHVLPGEIHSNLSTQRALQLLIA